MIQHILQIVLNEIRLEFRQKYAIAGIFIFLAASLFVVFKVFQAITPFSWNALFWILFLFVSINALIKSFTQMQAKRFMFYYQLYDPIELAISKIAYNAVLLFLLGVILFILMSVLSINPIVNTSLFLQALILGSLGIGSTISFTSLIASKGQQTHILISVLSMPIIIPILLLLVKITAVAMGILGDSSIGTDFLLLAGINMFSIGLCLILFPYLWRI